MALNRARREGYSRVGAVALMCFIFAGAALMYFKTDLFRSGTRGPVELSGLVSVRGSVSLKHLNFSSREIQAINKAVMVHKNTFTHVGMVVDAVGRVDQINESTVLVFAMELKTGGDLAVKSWSRKVNRKALVDQVVAYMYKAAKEYDEFKKFPDVKRNFKTLYI